MTVHFADEMWPTLFLRCPILLLNKWERRGGQENEVELIEELRREYEFGVGISRASPGSLVSTAGSCVRR